MNIRHRVELSEVERAELVALLSGGKHAARRLKRAQILLGACLSNVCSSAIESDSLRRHEQGISRLED